MTRVFSVLALCTLAAACASETNPAGHAPAAEPAAAADGSATSAADAPLPAHGLELPASFRGDLPCADCEGIRHHLDLWPDQVFHLSRTWLGRPDAAGNGDFTTDDLGRWHVDPARRALVLQAGNEMPLQFQIQGPRTIRALDVTGEPIRSELPYELTSDGTLDPVAIHASLGGEMVYMADAARFTECLTGRSYPIAMEEDYLALERAYLDAAPEPGAELYVTFEGSIAPRPKMEGDGTQPTAVVKRFINAWPDMRCERARADASLTNTYWRLVRMDGEPVAPVAGSREPHLILQEDQDRTRYVATVGCNQLLGTFELDGDALRFTPGPATLMACPPPLDEMEKALLETLGRTRSHEVSANTLELFGKGGDPVALLEAVYF